MPISTRMCKQDEGGHTPEDNDSFLEDFCESALAQESDEDDVEQVKSDGRIKPNEIRNPWGRKGKPKKEKTYDEMMNDALAKPLRVPQRDGSVRKVRLIQLLIETTAAEALKSNLNQRFTFFRMLERNGALARLDEFLSRDWEAEEARKREDMRRRVEDMQRRLLTPYLKKDD